jgi:hypothetical protein
MSVSFTGFHGVIPGRLNSAVPDERTFNSKHLQGLLALHSFRKDILSAKGEIVPVFNELGTM